MHILLLIFLLAGLLADGNSDGRKGNKAFQEGDFETAASAYRDGLLSLQENANPKLRFGLTNNLGATQYRLGEAETALSAFEAAARTAPDDALGATASYNAGNAAYQAQDLERALSHYRAALLRNPSDTNAKYNYELVRRKLQDQQDGGQQQQQGDEEQESNDDEQGEQQQQDQEQGDGEQEQPSQDGSPESQQDEDEPQNDPGEGDSDQQEEQDPGDQNQPGQQPREPTELSRDEAERILQAMENEESELLREVQRMEARPRRVEKDW